MQVRSEAVDFREVVESGRFFIDKSLMIKKLLNDGNTSVLITRPSGFGKSLNLSMLRYFFASEVDGRSTAGLFDGLKISEHPECMAEQGQTPVIFVSYRGIRATSFSEFLDQMRTLFAELYAPYERYFTAGSELERFMSKEFREVLNRQHDEYSIVHCLSLLTEIIYCQFRQHPVLLVDDYDTPLENAYRYGYEVGASNLLARLIDDALKDNRYLGRAVSMGRLQIERESLFFASSHNSKMMYDVLTDYHAPFFGFTEEEVEALLAQYPERITLEALRKQCGGYVMGEYRPLEVFHPAQVLGILQNGGAPEPLQPFWLPQVMQRCWETPRKRKVMEMFLRGGEVRVFVDPHITLWQGLEDVRYPWSLLISVGYLSVASTESRHNVTSNDDYTLRLTNETAGSELRAAWAKTDPVWVSALKKARDAIREGVRSHPWLSLSILSVCVGVALAITSLLLTVLSAGTSLPIVVPLLYVGMQLGLTGAGFIAVNACVSFLGGACLAFLLGAGVGGLVRYVSSFRSPGSVESTTSTPQQETFAGREAFSGMQAETSPDAVADSVHHHPSIFGQTRARDPGGAVVTVAPKNAADPNLQ